MLAGLRPGEGPSPLRRPLTLGLADTSSPSSPSHWGPTHRTRTPRLQEKNSGSAANLSRLTSRPDSPLRNKASNLHKPRPPLPLEDNECSTRTPTFPVQNSYTKDDATLIGLLKADILSVRSKVDDVRCKSDAEVSDLIRMIARRSASDDRQVEMDTRLFLLEVRDNQMCQLEALLMDRLAPVCHTTARCLQSQSNAARQTRMTSYFLIVDMLVSLASQHQEMRQLALEREASVQAMELQLRQLLDALETQNAQLHTLQRAAKEERERFEAAHFSACVARDANHDAAAELRTKVATLEAAKEELSTALAWFQKEQDRLQRECSFLGVEIEGMARHDSIPTRLVSTRNDYCDRCSTMDALCNSLQQESQEREYFIQKLKQDRDKQYYQSREMEKRFETELHLHQQTQREMVALTLEKRTAVITAERQEMLIGKLQITLSKLGYGYVLQAEAGERLAFLAEEANAMLELVWDFGRHGRARAHRTVAWASPIDTTMASDPSTTTHGRP